MIELLPELKEILFECNMGPLTVTRRGQKTQDDHGRFIRADASTFSLDPVTIHSLSGAEISKVPGSDRYHETIQLHTTQELRANTDAGDADAVAYQDDTFKVYYRDDYNPHAGVWIFYAGSKEVTS